MRNTPLSVERHQPAGTVNYPNEHDYTRITEQKIITGQSAPVTTLMKEFPIAHRPGETVPYYPIPRDENQRLYARYAEAAKKEFPNIIFAGRLGDYQYYNMDQGMCPRHQARCGQRCGELAVAVMTPSVEGLCR